MQPLSPLLVVLAAEPTTPSTPTATGTPTGTAGSTSTTAPPPGTMTHLTGSNAGWVLGTIVAFVLLAGLLVIRGRRLLLPGSHQGRLGTSNRSNSKAEDQPDKGSGRESDRTVVRSWLAISLVGGLLIFVAVSFWIDDPTLRSALVGGLVANAGAAVAFYFASKSSDQARQDILQASRPAERVPNLVGQTLDQVKSALAASSLQLEPTPPAPGPRAMVYQQSPKPGSTVEQGSNLRASFAGPIPNLAGLGSADAQAALEAVGLVLKTVPAAPQAGATVTDQEPHTGEPVPENKTVTTRF